MDPHTYRLRELSVAFEVAIGEALLHDRRHHFGFQSVQLFARHCVDVSGVPRHTSVWGGRIRDVTNTQKNMSTHKKKEGRGRGGMGPEERAHEARHFRGSHITAVGVVG
jgi:hypothetical protein